MSIWCTREGIGYDEPGAEPAGGEVWSTANGWSNHYPVTDGSVEQKASVDLAHIPTWCVPGHRDDLDDEWPFGPWVRLTVVTRGGYGKPGTEVAEGYGPGWGPEAPTVAESVLMDEAAARALAADLLAWADSEHVQPRDRP